MIENLKVNDDGSIHYDISDENKDKIYAEALSRPKLMFSIAELHEQALSNTDFKDIIVAALIVKSIAAHVQKEEKAEQKKKDRNKRKAEKRRNRA